ALLQAGAWSASDGRWLERPGPKRADRRTPGRAGEVRLHRRWRRGAPPAREVWDPGSTGVRGLPGERGVSPLRQPYDCISPQRQGLWEGLGGIAADVGSAPRYTPRRGEGLAALRTLCGVLDEVPQARIILRFLRLDRS